jgi:hypothetical protein
MREKEYIKAMQEAPYFFRVTLKEMREYFKAEPQKAIFKEDLKDSIYTVAIDFSIPVSIVKILMREL